ncbi:MAG: alanine--glyoxylate aminotransferase family protein [Deltaproteobacteria bacterium]|nr:alanine--glyoxylate aminotransferase family protein [Deltaproteobacteria bacterium]
MIDTAFLMIDGARSAKHALCSLDGEQLLSRTINLLEQSGLRHIAVIGCNDAPIHEVRSSISLPSRLGCRVSWHHGSNGWKRACKLAGAAALVVEANVLVGPRVFATALDLFDVNAPALTGVVAIDHDLSRLFDRRELLPLETRDGRLVGLCSENYDAVPVGVAVMPTSELERCGPASHDVLLQRAQAGGLVLTTVDVGGGWWQRVTSAETARHADWLLRAYGTDLGSRRFVEQAADRRGERTLQCVEALLSQKHTENNVLMNPGPVLTSPAVKSALVHHDVCHRDPDYARVARRIQHKLRSVCAAGADHEVLLFSGSGTAALEASISSIVPPTKKLLVVSNGAFGERAAEIAALHQIDVVSLRYEWGELIDPEAIERLLTADHDIAAVSLCHHETSVGILNPAAEVGAICRRHDRLLIVDAVSSLGGEDIQVERDQIDVLISSANKCLHAISGVSLVCVDPRVWSRIADVAPRVYYLDLKRYREHHIPFTPAVSSFYALDAALDEVLRGDGVKGRLRRYRRLKRRVSAGLARLGLKPLTETGRESQTISTVEVPSGIEFNELYAGLKRRGYVVYGCKAHLAGRYFQVANMGALTDSMVDGFLEALADVIEQGRAARAGSVIGRAAS